MKKFSLFIPVFLLLVLSPTLLHGQSQLTGEKTVTVGFYNDDSTFFNYDHSGERTGYGYDYLQKICSYTGWKLQYIDGTWAQLYKLFLKGEIDLMPDISIIPEREGKMLFPIQPMGNEEYWIYTLGQNGSSIAQNPKNLQGSRIAVEAGSSQRNLFEEWLAIFGITCDIIDYDTQTAIINDLYSGIIDGYLSVNTLTNKNLYPVLEIGRDDYYLAVNKSRPDLLEELNEAQQILYETNPMFKETLYKKYISDTRWRISLNTDENKWLEEKDFITIGVAKENMPFSDVDSSGNIRGVITQLAEYLESFTGIPVMLKAYSNHAEMEEALMTAEIDASFPNYSSFHDSELNGLSESDSVYSDRMLIIYAGQFDEHIFDSIVIRKDSFSQEQLVKKYFPDSKIATYKNRNDYFDALINGTATCSIGCGSILQYFINTNKKYSQLKTVYSNIEEDIVFKTRRSDTSLGLILNKAIAALPPNSVNSFIYSAMNVPVEYSLLNFIRHNLVLSLIFIVIMIAIMVLAFLWIFRREQIHNQQLEKALADTAAANKAKSEFLSNMSHDIRTPMNAIMGMTQIAIKNRNDQVKIDDCLAKIEIASGHLLSLINDVLDMSKLESSSIEIPEETVDIHQLLEECYIMLDAQAKAANVTLIRHLEMKPTYRYLLSSNLHLKQILINLGSNGIKYNKEGGILEFLLYQNLISDDIVEYTFVFKDTGIGMSPEFLTKLWEPFAQESSGSRSIYKGTGLGLSIVKSMTEKMGGKISVESVKDEGSVFRVSFPFKIDHMHVADESVSALECDYDLSNLKVLLVEDNPLNMEIAKYMLEDEGMIVSTAENGLQALEMVAGNPVGTFDLVFMDVMMPVMGGYEATRQIRAIKDGKKSEIPIIAMTANAFTDDIRKCLQSGMNAHISKPIEIGIIKKTLSNVLQKR